MKKFSLGTTVVVTSLPSGRALPPELIGAEGIVVKQELKGTVQYHSIDTILSVAGRRRYVLLPGSCLKKQSEDRSKKLLPEPDVHVLSLEEREQKEWQLDLIADELKAWPLGNLDPDTSAFRELWLKRMKLHATRVKLMKELYH